jgi:hypothetical protein
MFLYRSVPVVAAFAAAIAVEMVKMAMENNFILKY